MSFIHRILVPTDGSFCAGVALSHAKKMSERMKAEVLVLHVLEDPLYDEMLLEFDAMNPLQIIKQSGTVDELKSQSKGKLEFTLMANNEEGISQTIVAFAQSNEVDLVVMGSHGHSSVRRFLSYGGDTWMIGQTSRSMIQTCPIPVLTVGPRSTGSDFDMSKILTVVSPADGYTTLMNLSEKIAETQKTAFDVLVIDPYAKSLSGSFLFTELNTDLILPKNRPFPAMFDKIYEGHDVAEKVVLNLLDIHQYGMIITSADRETEVSNEYSLAERLVSVSPIPVLATISRQSGSKSETWEGRSSVKGTVRDLSRRFSKFSKYGNASC